MYCSVCGRCLVPDAEEEERKRQKAAEEEGCFEIHPSVSVGASSAPAGPQQKDWGEAYKKLMNKGPVGSGFNEGEKENEYGGHHRTLYDPNHNHRISWDTDANGDYVSGTGHESKDGKKVDDWDK